MCAPHKVNNKVAPSSLYPPVPDEIDGLSDRFKLLWFNHVSGLDAQQFKEYCEMQRTTGELLPRREKKRCLGGDGELIGDDRGECATFDGGVAV